MKHPRAAAVAFVLLAALSYATYRAVNPRGAPERHRAAGPSSPFPARIVSLSPSSTEILFAIGAGDRVVGVSRYCRYPAEARSRRAVGGYLDPNYEAIAMLEPDLVVLLPENDAVREYLDELGIGHVTVDNKRIEDILDAVEILGLRCGAAERALTLASNLAARVDSVSRRAAGLDRPRVLVSVEREVGAGVVREIYAAGRGGIYDQLVEIAGGVNAYERERPAFPIIAAEGILELDPDVVVDMVPDTDGTGVDAAAAAADWNGLPGFGEGRRVYVVSDDYAFVPGPRFVRFLEDLLLMIHPETGEMR